MANVDHIKVGSTSYDISPSPTGTLTTGTGGFSSSDVAQGSATSWTNVDQITTSDKHASIFTKITQMAKNVRYLYNVLGTGFSTSSTVKSQIDSKAPSSHSHSVGQLPTSSTQVNSNDYIPTSALIYSMNQTLTSLNDAYLPKSGGTMTGDISYKGSKSTYKMIKFIDNTDDTYGNGIGIGGGGLTVVGGGESVDAFIDSGNSTAGDERLVLCNDSGIDFYTNCQSGLSSANHCTIDANGYATFKKVYNAVYNDYAEFFPRGEETEPGDIVVLDLSSDNERYIKATSNSKIIAGIHSNEYAMIIGGESAEQGEDYIQKNIKKYIPVSLCGRVHCKCIGVIHKGDIIVVSDIPGIGRAKSPNENVEFTQIVGYAVDEDLNTDIRRVRIRVRG